MQNLDQLKQFGPIVLIFVVFYFLLIRPQQKAKKKQVEFLNSLKKNDKVITTGGLVGDIVSVDGSYVHISLDGTNSIKVLKDSIARSYVDEETKK